MGNLEIVKVQRLSTTEGEAQLKHMIERHFELTGSERADEILGNWDEEKGKFGLPRKARLLLSQRRKMRHPFLEFQHQPQKVTCASCLLDLKCLQNKLSAALIK